MTGNQNQAYYLLTYNNIFLTYLSQENEATISHLEFQKSNSFYVLIH